MSQPKAFTAIIFYVDKQGNERDQLALVVASTEEDAVRCLYETWSRHPDCASVDAIAVDPDGAPVTPDDIAEFGAAIAAHNACVGEGASPNARPANATLH